jgi:hypothetical protein
MAEGHSQRPGGGGHNVGNLRLPVHTWLKVQSNAGTLISPVPELDHRECVVASSNSSQDHRVLRRQLG